MGKNKFMRMIISKKNLSLDHEGNAYSYGWYKLAGRVGDTFFLNSHSYSPTTMKHRSIVARELRSMGIQWIDAPFPNGISQEGIKEAMQCVSDKIAIVSDKIKRGRNLTDAQRYRYTEFEYLKNTLHKLTTLNQ